MPEKRYVPPPPLDGAASQDRLTPAERHYSYECKGTTQDRPYIARPSRTQQLFNPKLVPKLNSDVLEGLEKK